MIGCRIRNFWLQVVEVSKGSMIDSVTSGVHLRRRTQTMGSGSPAYMRSRGRLLEVKHRRPHTAP
jgi:hypothetical protein